ncbi:MAG: DUF2520 domain-containing protein [Actinomycetota bacterium]|nr:DUF2520 domain-containing protein [Actinomycetota bacterium]
MTSVRIIGGGRAGRSFEAALSSSGVEVLGVLTRGDDPRHAAARVDAVLLAVPDRAVASVAAAVDPVADTVLLHCSGSLGLDVLSPHRRRASLHPLVSLPDPVIGALRLRGGPFFAVAGDQLATDLVLGLGGHPLLVPDDQRAIYHAAACIAANHVVALLGQVERVAGAAGLPLEAFLPLARGALDDVAMLGPTRALTGPAARGDLATIELHRRVLDSSELAGYDAGVALASRLAEEQAVLGPEPPVAATWT